MEKAVTIDEVKRESSVLLISALMFLSGMILAQIVDARAAQLLQFLALAVFIFFGFRLSSYGFESDYFRAFFILMTVWNMVTIFHGLDLSYEKIKMYLFSDFIFWPYIIPFAAFLSKRRFIYQNIFNWLTYSGAVFLVAYAACLKLFPQRTDILEQIIVVFSSGCGFILLTWRYHSVTRRCFAMFVIISALVCATVLARRNVMLTNINFLLATFLLYVFHYSNGEPLKRLLSVGVFIVVCFVAFVVFLERMDTDFKLIVNRANENTREYVFDYYFDDLKKHQWIGKGMNGTYFCPLFIPDTDSEPVEDRDLIECGYLQMVLKGGYISVIIFFMIALPAVYLGIFRSNNSLSKACGVLIILWLIDMIPYGIPSFSIRYILVWLAIGVCYSPSARMLTDRYFQYGQGVIIRRVRDRFNTALETDRMLDS